MASILGVNDDPGANDDLTAMDSYKMLFYSNVYYSCLTLIMIAQCSNCLAHAGAYDTVGPLVHNWYPASNSELSKPRVRQSSVTVPPCVLTTNTDPAINAIYAKTTVQPQGCFRVGVQPVLAAQGTLLLYDSLLGMAVRVQVSASMRC